MVSAERVLVYKEIFLQFYRTWLKPNLERCAHFCFPYLRNNYLPWRQCNKRFFNWFLGWEGCLLSQMGLYSFRFIYFNEIISFKKYEVISLKYSWTWHHVRTHLVGRRVCSCVVLLYVPYEVMKNFADLSLNSLTGEVRVLSQNKGQIFRIKIRKNTIY